MDSNEKAIKRSMETAGSRGGEEEVSGDPSQIVQTKGSEEKEGKEEVMKHDDQSSSAYINGRIQTEQDQNKDEEEEGKYVSYDQLPAVPMKESVQTQLLEVAPIEGEGSYMNQPPPPYSSGSVETEREPSTDGSSNKHPTTEMSDRRIMKNVLVISLFFFLNFMAYSGMAMLQSSLHRDEGMGVITSAIGWSSLALSCLLMPKIAIRLLGHKWCMSISIIGYLLWMAANGYAVWGTMIPANIIVGFSGAILWTTQGAYFALVAKHYARLKGQDPRAVTALFFGIFFAAFKTTSVFGSIISSTILSQRPPENETEPTDAELTQWCGLNDCPNSGQNNTNLSEPDSTTLWTLVGVYIGIGVLAFIVSCLFVDNVPAAWIAEDQSASTSTGKMVVSSLLATVKHMRHVRLLLLIPITVYTGLEQTFREAEYTKSFVSCYLGLWMIGWCMIPSSIVNAVVSILGGKVMKYTGLPPMFIFAFCADLTFQLILIYWTPSRDEDYLFYIVPIFNALADGIWLVQMSAVYGILFPTTFPAAFSNLNFWKAVGNIIEFAYSNYLCTSVKLYVVMGFLCGGMLLLIVVYFVFMRNPLRKTEQQQQQQPEISINSNETEGKGEIFMVALPADNSSTDNSLAAAPMTTASSRVDDDLDCSHF